MSTNNNTSTDHVVDPKELQCQKQSQQVENQITTTTMNNDNTPIRMLSYVSTAISNRMPSISYFNHSLSLPRFPELKESEQFHLNKKYDLLTESQKILLVEEAKELYQKNHSTWYVFNEPIESDDNIKNNMEREANKDNTIHTNTNTNYFAVYGTKSYDCPIQVPLDKSIQVFINELNKRPTSTTSLYLNHTVILPGETVKSFYHEQSVWSKIATGFRKHYNFENERHLYLKKNAANTCISNDNSNFANSGEKKIKKRKKLLVISIVGNLPESYMLKTVASLPQSYELSDNFNKALLENNSNLLISNISITSPLDSIDSNTCFKEVKLIMDKHANNFADIDGLFFIGYYHSVPLLFQTAYYIFNNFYIGQAKLPPSLGIWGIESCLSNQTLFEHSSDNDTNKKLWQNCTKQQQENITSIHKFASSKDFLSIVDWILYHTNTKITLSCKLYDNFMTIGQKLAINLKHPNIIRNVWVDLQYYNTPYRWPRQYKDLSLIEDPSGVKVDVPLPIKRVFEISLINDLILSLNLGYYNEAAPLLHVISPFFISRSFNKNTIPNVLKKQLDKDFKDWLNKVDKEHTDWKAIQSLNKFLFSHNDNRDDDDDDDDGVVQTSANNLTNLYDLLQFLEYIKYHRQIELKSEIYHDEKMYTMFLENTFFTGNLIDKKKLEILNYPPTQNIFVNTLQYKVVWDLHEYLSEFIKFKSLPIEEEDLVNGQYSLSSQFISTKHNTDCGYNIVSKYSSQTGFERNTIEAKYRVNKLWQEYWGWDPPIKGLKLLKSIFSIFEMYKSGEELIDDITFE
ncbi:uncharacterized protein SCODWIG_02555 [Saccharomycodes ludwigii]|uniref:Uncharacterized protein n=1 Tax=Saccharomycodes ludwigii TaxID=36035 RepID=A0A376B8D4_9ASCO|nr:hypothetical protein SCDLUD_002658 [Saccharomycodes ludwigii]KAH3901175.1 hypothetical protein SCDLUD_002658 [Saccharomycodes ludwigii]SSD60794.1 uncharacterized protein SCODWIG_02555 [Saccharomycodes ludwigii]